ncbi:marvel domain-containing protein [Diplogelasinospora grovesii]|uniref:Marvel domain-containing protein n=1 Tax=Diplogelasinospora grovesii TaxID=303347 RepID=A0AAN6S9G0_9PEZI|nr:marvel domain-containing protein [Diplogelasinospora grovesii]
MQLLQIGLRALQLLWIVLLTALIGNVIALNRTASGSAESAVNFTMFVIVISWLATLYGLAAAVVEQVAIPVVLLALDGIVTLFTFINAIVLAAKVRAVNCSNTADLGSDWIGYGSDDNSKRCREIQASTAFMWFLWASFTVGLILMLVGFRRSGTSVRSGAPTMSQVRV